MGPLLGVHFGNEAREYHVPSLVVEHVYCFNAQDRKQQYGHWDHIAGRVRRFQEKGHTVFLKVKYIPNQDQPLNASEVEMYLNDIKRMAPHFKRSSSMHARLKVCFGNEPNWDELGKTTHSVEASEMASIVVDAANVWNKYRGDEVEFYITPVAPYAERDAAGSTTDNRLEDSPWARYAHDFYRACLNYRSIHWQGVAIHAYSRVAGLPMGHRAREPWMDVREDRGWRWGSTVVETFKLAYDIASTHLYNDRMPFLIVEYNCFMDGTSESNYPKGLLFQMWAYCCMVLGVQFEGLAWFIDDPRPGWEAESLSLRSKLMADADDDFIMLNR